MDLNNTVNPASAPTAVPRVTPRHRYRHPTAVGLALGAILFLVVLQAPVSADLRVQALFSGRALFILDNERFVLRDGEEGPGGVRLLRATPSEARIEYLGRERTLKLESGRFAGTYQTRPQPELRVFPDAQGTYLVAGSINGQQTRFIVDTGATLITLSEVEARQLRLPLTDALQIPIETASGRVLGWAIRLERVQIGELDQPRVDAVVLPGERPVVALLGMSFLSRLNLRSEGNLLVLQARQ